MSIPTAIVHCNNCKREGIIEVFGPTKEIQLPSGWLFVRKSLGFWRAVTWPLTVEAFEYIEDLRVVCKPTCAMAVIDRETR